MEWVQMVKTSDGKLHNSERQAKQHAELRYTNAVNAVAGPLFNLIHGPSKVADIAEFIDTHLKEFNNLQGLREDWTNIEVNDEP